MDIDNKKIKKIKSIFVLLGFSDKEISENFIKLSNLLLSTFAYEALAGKGFKPANADFDQAEFDNFLKENYSEEEAKNLLDKVSNDVTEKYFSQVLTNIPEDKMEEIGKIMNEE